MEEIEFDNQRPNEKAILLKKRHPWVLWKSGLFLLILVIAVLLSYLIFGASKISVIVTIVAALVVIYHLVTRFFVYNNDIFIVTDQRVINIDQSGFFARRVSEAELENIQNVTYEIKGPVRSMLNFGDIIIATAGNTIGLTLRNVENPHFIQEKIVELQKKAKQKPISDNRVLR